MILSFIFGVVITFFALGIVTHCKDTQPKNNVHFYIARDKDGILALWLGKPHRGRYIWTSKGNKMIMAADIELNLYGLNIEDYKDLKWKDEPVEVFLNLED